jgi:hypothetical protein
MPGRSLSAKAGLSRAITITIPAEFLTPEPGFSYGSVRSLGLHVAQQTCRPGYRETTFLSVSLPVVQ